MKKVDSEALPLTVVLELLSPSGEGKIPSVHEDTEL